MVENENQGLEEAEEQSAPSSSYEALAGIGNEEFKREPWYLSLGRGILNVVLKCLIWVLSFLIDVVLGLCKIVAFVFKAIAGIFVGAYYLVRKFVRIWRDVDWSYRLGFIVQGAGNLRAKQWLDGFVFLGVEIIFVLYMALFGGGFIADLINLSEEPEIIVRPGGGTMAMPGNNQLVLLLGVLTIIICVAYALLFITGIRAMYDTHQIVHQSEYSKARADAAYVIDHYNEFSKEVDGHRKYLADMGRKEVFDLMQLKYGYSRRSAAYISYVYWKKVKKTEPNALENLSFNLRKRFYEFYKDKAVWMRARTWCSPLERFLFPKEPELVIKGGIAYLAEKQKQENTVFHHKFDKYNDYHSFLRDEKTLIRVFDQGEKLYDALFARDPVSQSNGIKPLPFGSKLRYGMTVTRVVGAFEIPLDMAKKVTKVALRSLSAALKTGSAEEEAREAVLADFEKIRGVHEARVEDFVEKYGETPIRQSEAMAKAYRSYLELRRFYDEGDRVFTSALVDAYGLSPENAKRVYRDYKFTIAGTKDDEMESIKSLETRAGFYDSYTESIKKTPHHGKPTGSLKRVKEFADEKFAISVMTIPTLGAIIVTILPLICSIIVGFTNWDAEHTANLFTWDLSGFSQVFNVFGSTSGASSYGGTFVRLLGWTIVWAIFATFTNYIAGILLALLINRKTIKGKAIYRTMFVLSIAIPQFITLLAMNLLLSSEGPVNSFLMTTFGFNVKFFTDTANMALIPKIMCIIVNMWIGVPYTMLSVSGILMNIPEDLYESARIDGAGPFRQLVSITMPYVVFVTGPSLITTFVGNINNFNVIFFLVGTRGPNKGMAPLVSTAADTDLLVNWLYNLCTGVEKNYNIASVIGLAIFAVCAFLSLVVYNRMGSVKNEEAFQ